MLDESFSSQRPGFTASDSPRNNVSLRNVSNHLPVIKSTLVSSTVMEDWKTGRLGEIASPLEDCEPTGTARSQQESLRSSRKLGWKAGSKTGYNPGSKCSSLGVRQESCLFPGISHRSSKELLACVGDVVVGGEIRDTTRAMVPTAAEVARRKGSKRKDESGYDGFRPSRSHDAQSLCLVRQYLQTDSWGLGGC